MKNTHFLALSVGGFFVAAACGPALSARCEETWSCPPQDAGAQTDTASPDGGPIIPPTCDLTKGVKESPDCVDDGVGVFASPTGDDAAPGTKLKPVRSITKAVELASTSAKPRVYLCTGTYTDSVEVQRPVSFFGGFTCNGGQWSPAGAAVTWNAVKPDFALRIMGVGQRVVVEDVEITAKDGVAPGESSIGIFVAESTDVALSRVMVAAERPWTERPS